MLFLRAPPPHLDAAASPSPPPEGGKGGKKKKGKKERRGEKVRRACGLHHSSGVAVVPAALPAGRTGCSSHVSLPCATRGSQCGVGLNV